MYSYTALLRRTDCPKLAHRAGDDDREAVVSEAQPGPNLVSLPWRSPVDICRTVRCFVLHGEGLTARHACRSALALSQATRALCRTKSKPRACTLLCRVDIDQLLVHGSQTAWQHGSCVAVAGMATLMEAPATSVTLQPTPTKTSTPVPQVRRDCLRGSSSWNVEAVQRSHSSRRELGTGRDWLAQVCEVGEVVSSVVHTTQIVRVRPGEG